MTKKNQNFGINECFMIILQNKLGKNFAGFEFVNGNSFPKKI